MVSFLRWVECSSLYLSLASIYLFVFSGVRLFAAGCVTKQFQWFYSAPRGSLQQFFSIFWVYIGLLLRWRHTADLNFDFLLSIYLIVCYALINSSHIIHFICIPPVIYVTFTAGPWATFFSQTVIRWPLDYDKWIYALTRAPITEKPPRLAAALIIL